MCKPITMQPRTITPSPPPIPQIAENQEVSELLEFTLPIGFNSPESSQEDMLAILPPPPSPIPLTRSCGRCSCCCDTRDQGYCKTFGFKIKTREELLKLLNQ